MTRHGHPAASPSDLIQQVVPSRTGVVLQVGAGFFECNVRSITPGSVPVPNTRNRAGM